MKSLSFLFCLLLLAASACQNPDPQENWISLFNGKDLSGWKANENPASFRVENGLLIAEGPRSHLFYVGEEGEQSFRNFELQLEILTHLHANSGVYYHTTYQEEGWPSAGHEVQVNNTHIGGGDYRELKKTGSLYSIRNVYKAFAQDSVWFTMTIRVEGRHLSVKVNDVTTVDYWEPGTDTLSGGTFALQGHDPGSKVYYRNIRVKRLPDGSPAGDTLPYSAVYDRMIKHQSNQFAFIDLHVNRDAAFDLTSALKTTYREGINLGILPDDGTASVSNLAGFPVFAGLEANDRTLLSVVSPEDLKKFDYTLSNLNVPGDESSAQSDPQTYLEGYFTRIMEGLADTAIDIWATPTLLPSSLRSDYDKIWTETRIHQALALAKASGIAIEIDNRLRLPDLRFIRLAKEKGCLFTYSHIAAEADRNDSDYFLTVIDSCGLGYKDFFVPGW
ncbi:MAG: family 16 glycoside hydrolase [Bacteroidia bacterium]|nr:family 16 glycoside hydrolase [Bacteroidia bacterium]